MHSEILSQNKNQDPLPSWRNPAVVRVGWVLAGALAAGVAQQSLCLLSMRKVTGSIPKTKMTKGFVGLFQRRARSR